MPITSEIDLDCRQHIVLDDMSWDLYEHLLREVGERPLRVTYCRGKIEIMSPLPEHERWSRRIAALISLACVERNIAMVPLGSTTFRDAAREMGLEPDECFYFGHADDALKMEGAFDPDKHPPPDLAVEIDITQRSIAREPIYAALGVPELWRFDGQRLGVRKLNAQGAYEPATSSDALPFLPIASLESFLTRHRHSDDTSVLRSFQQWVRALKP